MKKKMSWDDIPSLELGLDDASAANSELRSAVRLASRDVLKMLTENGRVIYVQIATRNGVLKRKGVLQDINQHGLSFIMPAHGLRKNDSIRIGVMLGRRPFKSNAVVRWATNDQAGIEYVKPDPEDVAFLSELYSAKILNRI